MTRSTSTRGDFSSSSRSNENNKIEEGISLLVRREKYGNNVFKCWRCDEFDHYASKCPKREKKYKGKCKSRRDRNRNCLYENKYEESMRKVKVKVRMN